MAWLDVVSKDLTIPVEYLKPTSNAKRFLASVHRIWFRDFLNGIYRPFLHHEVFTNNDVRAKVQQIESLGNTWIYVLITVVQKLDKSVIPLGRRHETVKFEKDLSYSQQLQYVTVTNRTNLWKEAYTKYDGFFCKEKSVSSNVCLSPYNTVIREVFTRFYNCPIINLKDRSQQIFSLTEKESHCNILPANLVFETNKNFYLLQETSNVHSFQDCINYSPALLKSSRVRPMFVFYQLLNAMQNTHDQGLVLGDITFLDIVVSPELWIQILPKLTDNIYDTDDEFDNNYAETVKNTNFDSLAETCEQWVRGNMSNFDYISFLNKLSGRKYGDPKCHYVFPWVTDFSSRAGLNYRDLTKSKYRLNKGDRQLDLTYDVGDEKVTILTPHHVPDILSEITYYVYRSRVTPRSVLCRYIRTKFVPEEYPSSIQRMQQWSPDECIPEFFTDPSIFKSIHKELPDLGIPTWAENVQDLIETHRAILESNYISERLHHWIDLTFGYKLSGSAAVKSKNVCLQLCDNHTYLSSSGIVQLFTQPHPQRLLPSPYFSRMLPVLPKLKTPPIIEEQHIINTPADNETLANGFTKYLDLSKTPLCLPPDYNPATPLIALDSLNNFLNGACIKTIKSATSNDFHAKNMTSYKKIIANQRAREIQVLGCLTVELFLADKVIAHGSNLASLTFSKRLQSCRVLASTYQKDLPDCIRHVVKLLLQINKIPLTQHPSPFDFNWCSVVTDNGLPPPTPHQLLIPSLSSSILCFPKYFSNVHNTLRIFYGYITVKSEMESVKNLLEENQKFTLDMFDTLCNKIILDIENEMCKLGECGTLGILNDSAWIEFLVPMVIELLSDSNCNILTALHLLEPSFKALGMQKSKEFLLDHVTKLYEECLKDISQENIPTHHKWIKLYQKSFLMKIISGFGTRVFLKSFVPILVETVGSGCNFNRDYPIPIQYLNELCGSSPSHKDNILKSTTDTSQDIKVVENDTLSLDDEALTNSIVSLQDVLLDDQDVIIDYDRQSADTNFSDDKSCDVTASSSEDDEDVSSCLTPDSEKFNTEEHLKVSEVSADSLVWVSNRIGPVHTSMYITKNLLKMLMLCYSDSLQNDDKAIMVINCLMRISDIYGEQIILIQYLPHISDVVSLCKRSKMTASIESGLIGCVTLLKYLMSHFTKSTLNEISQDTLCKGIIHPMLRILSSQKVIFPSGAESRGNFATKLFETIYFFSLKQGHLISKTIQRLFLVFDKLRHVDPLNVVDINSRNQTIELNNSDSGDSPSTVNTDKLNVKTKAMEQLCKVLTPELAYHSYTLFVKYLGESFMQRTLMNWDYIKEMCVIYKEERVYSGYANIDYNGSTVNFEEQLGTHLTLKGNKIHFQDEEIEVAEEAKNLVESRHLRGNWLAYWEHEIGRNIHDTRFNFKQIKLQTFSGHQSTVKSLSVLDNENSFISSSRDKTVKLWSLRNQGDGNSISHCQYTYTRHRKSVLSVAYLEKLRMVASCDSSIHVWDPWSGGRLLCSMNCIPVNILKCLPTPHPNILAASTQPTLHSVDPRSGKSVAELKISMNATGLIRSIAVPANGHWVAVGQSSGYLTVIDLRTGQALANWKGHEGEVLQLLAVDSNTIVSSSLDQSLSVWNISNGNLIYNMRGSPEPVHCLGLHGNELISGTTANRIGIHTGFTSEASFSSTKIKTDTFKGVLTSMSVLSLNQLLLLGADNGNITLLC